MSVPELIRDLEDAGVYLWEETGNLKFRAPRGVLTEPWRVALRESKGLVLEYLRTRTGRDQVVSDPIHAVHPFPLTDVQTAYLLGRRSSFPYGGVGCHGYAEFFFSSLDPAMAESSWSTLVQRHPMLRAVINTDGTQRVLAQVPHYSIRVENLGAAPTPVWQAALSETRRDMDHHVYEPDQWPLFDIRITITPEGVILHFSIDLLVSDFSSTQILIAEFQTLLSHPSHPLPPLGLTFRDYSLEAGKKREAGIDAASREYWLRRIDEIAPAPELPLRIREGCKPGFRRWHLRLDEYTSSTLINNAGKHGITPSAVLLAIFSEVLARWASHRRFTVNITLQQRAQIHKDVNDIVGDFTTLNLLSVDMETRETFLDRAQALQAQLWEDLDHRWFTGSQVMREITKRQGGLVLFPIVFTSSVGANSGREWPEVRYGITQTPQVWLDCQVAESQGGLFLNWDVREGIFPDGLIDSMFSAFHQLLQDAAKEPSTWQKADPIPLPACQLESRRMANATTDLVLETLLHQCVIERLAKCPEEIGIIASDGLLTNRELLSRALGLATALRAEGVVPNDRVAIVLDKGCSQPVAVLAIMLCGAAYVPVETSQPARRRNLILEDSAVRMAVAHSTITVVDNWPPQIRLLFMDDVAPSPVNGYTFEPLVSPDAPAYLIYTSGSTGTPKGVVMSHRSAMNTIRDINLRFNVGSSDRVLGLSSLGFDLSVYDIFGVLGAGGCLVLPDPARRNDPSHWAQLVTEHHVTMWNSVPALMHMFCRYLDSQRCRPSATLRLALLSGDWIPLPLPQKMREFWPEIRIISLGGATEAAIWSIFYEVFGTNPEWTSIPYGRPLANQRWHVIDSQMRCCPDHVSGELYIAGEGLAIGYWNDPEKTAARFLYHPLHGERLYKTGDWGKYLPDGSIEFLGRDDRQIKIRGYRIELAEVEAALAEHPEIVQATVIAAGPSRSERRLYGFVTLKDVRIDAATMEKSIRSFLATKLPDYMVPSQLEIVDALPISPNGKVDMARLQFMIGEMRTAPAIDVAPLETELERQIGSIWANSLNLSRIDRTAGFVTLGGDSLQAAQISGRIRDEIEAARHLYFDELLMPILADKSLMEIAALIERNTTRSSDSQAGPASQLVTLRSIVAGNGKTVLLVVTEADDLFRIPKHWPGRAMLLMDVHNERLIEQATQRRLELVADACVDALLDLNHLQIEIIGVGKNAVLALEIARRMTESGALIDRLYVVPVHSPQNNRLIGNSIAEGIDQWKPEAYAGDLTLLLPPESTALEDEHLSTWTSICLGDVVVEHAD